jgi:transcription elongation factor Elf1
VRRRNGTGRAEERRAEESKSKKEIKKENKKTRKQENKKTRKKKKTFDCIFCMNPSVVTLAV